MSEFLVIRLGEDGAHASWLVVNEQGHRLSNTMSGPLAAAATQTGERAVIVIVSGLEAATRRAKLPVKRPSRIQQMLAYTLEDTVAEDVDRLLFAAGPRQPDGSISVAIVARELVEHWLSECKEAGISPSCVYIDVQGVPETPGSLTLLLEGHKVFGRLPDREPFVFEDLPLDEMLALVAEDDDDTLKNIVVYADEDSYRAREDELARVRDHVSALDVSLLPDGALARLAATLVNIPGSNLLQGPYALRSDWNQLLRPWRIPAALALAFATIATASLAVRYYSLSREDQALTASLQSNCEAAFAVTAIPACDTEIRNRLASTGQTATSMTATGFLGTLSSVAEARDPRMVFQAMSFRGGVTNLSLVAPDVQSLDSLAQALGNNNRLEANIQSATPGDDGVEGRIQIAEARQ